MVEIPHNKNAARDSTFSSNSESLPGRDLLDYSCEDCAAAPSCQKKAAVTCPVFELRKDSPFRIVEESKQENVGSDLLPVAAMRKTIPIFASEHLWSKAEQQIDSLGEKQGTTVRWSILRVKEDRRTPPVIVIDSHGYLRPSSSEICLVSLDPDELREKLSQVPKDIREKLKEIVSNWGVTLTPSTDLAAIIWRTHLAYGRFPDSKIHPS